MEDKLKSLQKQVDEFKQKSNHSGNKSGSGSGSNKFNDECKEINLNSNLKNIKVFEDNNTNNNIINNNQNLSVNFKNSNILTKEESVSIELKLQFSSGKKNTNLIINED